jgi:TonB family protein
MLSILFNHLWQSTLVVAVIALLCFRLRSDGAHIRYWLWWAASAKFLVPFSLLAALGREISGVALPAYVSSDWTLLADRVAQPIAPASSSSLLGIVLLAAWASGSIVVLLRWIVLSIRLRNTLRRAEPHTDPISDGRRRIRVYHTAEAAEPCIARVICPVLLLPKDIEKHLSETQLEAVIAHELCHVRRCDNLTAAMHMLAEVLFWFYPLIWWIGSRLIRERERACDQMVVQLGHDRETYAEGILKVCELYALSRSACAAGAGGDDLMQRITQIMRVEAMMKLRIGKKVLLTGVLAGTISAPILGGLFQQAALAQQEDPPRQLVRIAPEYPPEAIASALSGRVVVEYTVTERGTVQDIIVVDSTSSLFDSPTVASVQKYKYEPQAEPVPGVRMTVLFELDRSACGAYDRTRVVCVAPRAATDSAPR